MPPRSLILAIDQGTTSTRAMLFDRDGAVRGRAQRELSQSYPADGWVEHDPEEIWRSTLALARQAMADPGAVAGVGLANQRETTVVWDRATGEAIHPAIVWQDRRTASLCERLRADGLGPMVRDRTGLVLDPYFSATKIAWILDNVAGARGRADRGELAFGTIDSFLIWRLTGGAGHVTDATNASRTLLFDLARQDWDDDLLRLFRVPPSMLPTVVDCAGDFGATPKALFGRSLPIAGVAGDQQAATIGQACVAPGMIKSTYGTGCFALMNTGSEIRTSRHKLLTTLAYRLNGMPTFALEGSIFVAGAAVQWLRDGLKIIGSADETEGLAAAGRSGVVMVPAFVGLGAPYWDADARGAIHGLTRDSGPAELARAALEAVCFQTRDLVDAMAADAGNPVTTLRVDGGMTANRWFLQALADVTGLAIERPRLAETTAYGAALLAGIGTGLIAGLGDLAGDWRADERFEPRMAEAERAQGYDRWRDAVNRTLSRGP